MGKQFLPVVFGIANTFPGDCNCLTKDYTALHDSWSAFARCMTVAGCPPSLPL